MGRKVLLFALVLAGLIVAGVAYAQFYAPLVDKVSTETALTEGAGGGAAIPAAIGNESKAEMEKIDTDGDGISDWFEKNYMYTDPNVPNDRYVLFLTTMVGSYREGDVWWTEKDIFLHFMERNKVLSENIIIDNATTFSEFKEYIDWLAERSDENDFVYIYLHSHGDPYGGGVCSESISDSWVIEPGPTMEFADEQGNEHGGEIIFYRDIGKMLNRVKCNKMLIATSSCAFNASVEPLSKEAKYPRVVVAPVRNEAIGSFWPVRIKEWTNPFTGMIYKEWVYPKTGEIRIERTDPVTGISYNPENGFSKLAKEIYKREFLNGPYGTIGDEFLTVKTWLECSKKIDHFMEERTRISDESNVSGEFYFGETRIKDYYPVV